MKNYLKLAFLIFFFPIDLCFLEEINPTNDEDTNNFKYYIGGLLIIIIIFGLFYYGGDIDFSNFNKIESEIEYRPSRKITDFDKPLCPIYQIQQTILK